MKKLAAVLLATSLCVGLLSACAEKAPAGGAASSDAVENVTLTICGPWTDSLAFENAAQSFHERCPNCTVEYEYLQNYEESAVKRLEKAPDTIDFVLTSNIQSDSPFLPYAEDLDTHPELDLSGTNDALIKNFTFFKLSPDEPD